MYTLLKIHDCNLITIIDNNALHCDNTYLNSNSNTNNTVSKSITFDYKLIKSCKKYIIWSKNVKSDCIFGNYHKSNHNYILKYENKTNGYSYLIRKCHSIRCKNNIKIISKLLIKRPYLYIELDISITEIKLLDSFLNKMIQNNIINFINDDPIQKTFDILNHALFQSEINKNHNELFIKFLPKIMCSSCISENKRSNLRIGIKQHCIIFFCATNKCKIFYQLSKNEL